MKIIRISSCAKCPSLIRHDLVSTTNDDIHFFDLYWYCGREMKYLGRTISDVPEQIPEWCPLEDI